MTDYNTIANGDVDADSPLNTTLLTRLRDNPLALFEGATGAPRLQTAGIADDAVVSDKIDLSFGAYTTEDSSSWLVPEGIYMISVVDYLTNSAISLLDIYNGTAWVNGWATFGGGVIISDGTNFRLRTIGGNLRFQYRKLA